VADDSTIADLQDWKQYGPQILCGWSLDEVYTYTSGSDFSIGTGADYDGGRPWAQYWVANGPLRVTN
jgi:hypothetical protein